MAMISCAQRDCERSDRSYITQDEDQSTLRDRLKCIEDSIALLGSQVSELYGKTMLNPQGQDVNMLAQLDNVAARVDRMELLLLRTPIEDFKVLDTAISHFLPSGQSPHLNMRDVEVEDSKRFVVKDTLHSDVNISINPEYIDQFCMAANVTEVDAAHIDIVRSQGQEQMRSFNCYDGGELEQLEDPYSDDGEDVMVGDGPLEELVARVRSGDLEICDLTDDEARWFNAALKNDSRAVSRGSWQPWWQRPEVDGSHQSASSSSTRSVATRINPPVHICCVNGRRPHASVAFTSWSALYAYAYTMRASNGGWEWAPLEAAPNILHVCSAICSHQIFKSADECVRASLDAAATLEDGGFGADFDVLCVADVQSLISAGAHCCAVALQDIVNIFDACLAAGSDVNSGKLRKGIKKLDFLTSFVFHHFEVLQPLASVTVACAQARTSQAHEKQNAAQALHLGSISTAEMD